jgi:DHA1 family tetracycline resistance protein-like MFS transporter
MNRRLAIIALILFVNALGSGLVLPLLPFYAIEMGASPLAIGVLIATLPFCASLSGPPLGALSDRYGRKPILVVSVAGTLAGFLLLGVAQTLPLVFLARIVDGLSAGNTSTARAAIADITSREARAGALGVTFAMDSLGLILGPVLGGFFSSYGLSAAVYVAAGIAGVCLLLTVFAFPETRAASQASAAPAQVRLGDFVGGVGNPRTRMLVLVIFFVQLLIMMMWGTLALYARELFVFGAPEMGYLSAFAALVGITAQTGLLRLALKVARDKTILVVALFTMAAGLVLLAASGVPLVLLVGVGLMAASFNAAMPTATGFASRLSAERDQGKLMGTVTSALSLASVTGPIVGGAIFSVSMRGSYLVASAIAVAAATLCLARIEDAKSD